MTNQPLLATINQLRNPQAVFLNEGAGKRTTTKARYLNKKRVVIKTQAICFKQLFHNQVYDVFFLLLDLCRSTPCLVRCMRKTWEENQQGFMRGSAGESAKQMSSTAGESRMTASRWRCTRACCRLTCDDYCVSHLGAQGFNRTMCIISMWVFLLFPRLIYVALKLDK